ncbi:hypothetical protein FACUT_10574 [Fusarium acutatum]|uniref:Alpha/beta-hydrolase n=1 Tax=Fusarium acutatum TaxID=78861 RepID=A0A8H4JGK9_9HYPO|nr:hypothetical protein FACUT_10574 [Fusarium acutatum]
MNHLPSLGTDIQDVLSPTVQIYTELLQQNVSAIHSVSKDREMYQYGQHPRQNLDIYTPKEGSANSPIILWAHGGGLVAGDKNLPIPGDLVYSNVGYFFASRGFTTVLINYRLVNSHDAKFPSGGEDIAAAIEWLITYFQGQSRDLFGLGNSAGGIHWSTFLFHSAFGSTMHKATTGDGIRLRGVTLLSVPFEFSKSAASRAEVLQTYFGDDVAGRCPYGLMNSADDSVWGPLERGKVQIHVGSFSLDPEDEILFPVRRFIATWQKKRLVSSKPKLLISNWEGHNHISPFLALGTDITREEAWGNELVEWMKEIAKDGEIEPKRIATHDTEAAGVYRKESNNASHAKIWVMVIEIILSSAVSLSLGDLSSPTNTYLTYLGLSWKLTASTNGLYAAVLADLFHNDEKDHVGPLINSIAINTLSVEYTYERQIGNNAKSVGSTFSISGDLVIAELRLNLDFRYTSSGFTFSAELNPADRNATIRGILMDLLGSSFDIPDFFYDTLIAGDNEDAFRIDIQKIKDPSNVESFQFLTSLNIGRLQFPFSQLHSTRWGAKDPSKRLFMAVNNGFGDMKLEIPLVGTLYRPLDELYFIFVQDPEPPDRPGQLTGLTLEDIDLLNNGILQKDQLLVADKIKPGQAQPNDLLVPSGRHFAVIIRNVAKGERVCLLSYGLMKLQPSSSQALLSDAAENGRRRSEEEMDDGGPSAQAPFKKDTGPIAISNVGLKYKTLSIVFDATFQLGPIGFSLLGFTLNTRFKSLDELPTISVNIDGLAASFDRRPSKIAGIIVHCNDGVMDYYVCGLIIGFRPYQFQAAGFCGVITLANSSNSFQRVFVFAKLNDPLMTLAFAEISGICGGFGYNSSVRLPSVGQVSGFPFINSGRLSDNENAQQVLMGLVDPSAGGWFQPLDSTYWGAIVMKLSAFRMLSVDAVVAVQFGDSVKLGIFAAALGIAAVLEFDYGFLKIEAQLSPRSYILNPNCHLTGGFALCYWFNAPLADRARIGDFVFTLGGYHQPFRVPVGYPNPPRLGISWDLGGGLSISGEAYFAITTKACMAGGCLHAAFKAGPLSAWFDAFANFLINYRPFYFDMSAGVSVGVGFSIDFWFIHIRISVQIGAELYLWGPPVAGRVPVDFWIVAFDINFGDHHPKIDPVSLSEFYELVLQGSPASSFASATSLITGKPQQEPIVASTLSRSKNEAHNFLAESGLLNPDDQPERGQEDPWAVRAGTFVYVAECKMAISSVTTSENGNPILQGNDVFSKPMGMTKPMTSTLQIQVVYEDGSNPGEDWQFERYTQMPPRAWDGVM